MLPLYKSGLLMETNNYRLISILPILSNLLERYVHTIILEYLETYNLLTIAQSGFRRLHSIVTSLLHATDSWLKNIDEGLVTGVVFIDLQKDFGTVDVDILLAKLTSFGIGELSINGFRVTYLYDLNHYQYTWSSV